MKLRTILQKYSNSFMLILILLKQILFYHRINRLTEEYRIGVLKDLENLISPDVCIITEGEDNYGIFESIVKNGRPISPNNNLMKDNMSDVYLIRKIRGRLTTIDDINKDTHIIASFSPFLASFFNNQLYFYSTEGRFRGPIKEKVLNIYEYMKNGYMDEYKSDMIEYKREYDKESVIHRFKIEGTEDIIETVYNTVGDDMGRQLKDLEEWILSDRNNRSIHLITHRLIEMLLRLRILKERLDLEEYPELIPTLFPYKMMKTGEIIKIGVDLSKIKEGIFEEYFDLENEWLKKNGLKHFKTVFTGESYF